MTTRQPDPLRLNVAAFAADGGQLSGDWPGDTLTRLADSQTPPQDAALADVRWQAAGERRPVTGSEPELWLSVSAHTQAWLTCQRCLQPYALALDIDDKRVRFVRGEAEAEALDGEIEDDVLALPRALDLRELVEDELLLALPIVPRHEGPCPEPLPMPADDLAEDDAAAERPNPFAALQALKTREAD
jgi:uncharacterized protein